MASQSPSPSTTPPDPSLHLAIKALQPDLVQKLITEGADVHSKQPEPIDQGSGIPQPITPLTLAAKNPDGEESLAILTLLIKAGVSIEKDPDALLAALRKGRAKMVDALLKANADPNLSFTNLYGKKKFLLREAIEEGEQGIVHLLLDAKATIRSGDVEAAAEKGDAEVVKTLFNKKATLSSSCDPMVKAVQGGDVWVVQRFIEAKADVNHGEPSPPLAKALLSERYGIAKVLSEAKADAYQAFLSVNTELSRLPVEQARSMLSFLSPLADKFTEDNCFELLKQRIDYAFDRSRTRLIDEVENEESTPKTLVALLQTIGKLHDLRPVHKALDYAIERGVLAEADVLDKFIFKKRRVTVLAGLCLPPQGSRVVAINSAAESKKPAPRIYRSIRQAIQALDLPAVDQFLAKANPNLEISQELPLVTAIEAPLERKVLPIVFALLKAKARLDKPDNLLLMPIKSGRAHILRALLEAKANPNASFKKAIKISSTRSLLRPDSDLPERFVTKQESILQCAIELQDENAVKVLLRFNAQVGEAELTAASSRNNREIMAALLKTKPNVKGLGLLHSCIKGKESVEVLKQLIHAKVDLEENVHRQTPLAVATIFNCPPLARLLLEAGAKADTNILHNLYRNTSFDVVLISELIKAKADINALDVEYTPLQKAVVVGDSLRFVSRLLEAKASPYYVPPPKRNPYYVSQPKHTSEAKTCSAIELAYQKNVHQRFIDVLKKIPKPGLYDPLESEVPRDLAAQSAEFVSEPVPISVPEKKETASSKKTVLPHSQSFWAEMTKSYQDRQVVDIIFRLADTSSKVPKFKMK